MMELLGSLADSAFFDFITPAIPAFLILMIVEGFILMRDKDGDVLGYSLKDTTASLTMGIGSLFVPKMILTLIGLGGYVLVWREFRFFDLGTGWIAWVVAMMGKEFLYYWSHRFGHEWRVLWAAHVVHHSSDHYNLSTALRQTWTPLTGWLFYLPMILLGVNPILLAMAGALNLLYQFGIHTEAIRKLPAPIELIFNTPSHHRVHHGVQAQYLDRNYGGILIIWDRLFGTFEPEGERPIYGITTPLESYNPLKIATHEYSAILADMRTDDRWSDRLRRLVNGPGWDPRAEVAQAAALTAADPELVTTA
ncbi:MAG: sterol desaturase/sphingolipid hydroxylase (fatty acid hydroxylase superfamily) [Glaciecola sp.]|jgi:sterol desaturase/sphingolipid hydroxylase (fatty acid hydroxylase superfamily)